MPHRMLLATTLTALVAAAPATGSQRQHDTRCATACVYTIKAQQKARDWATPWPAERDDTLAIVVTVNGHDLDSEQIDSKTMRFTGQGVLVRARSRTIGPTTFRLVTVNDRSVSVRLWIKRV